MRRVPIGILGLAALACVAPRSSDRVPAGDGPLIAVYKAAIDDGHGAKRGAKLAVWAQSPDRLHVEMIAPVGGVAFTLDAGGDSACVVDVDAKTAYVGNGGPEAIEALVGVRLSIADAVAALLSGAAPPGVAVMRRGAVEGVLPEGFRIADGARSLTLERVRFERGGADPSSLGTGTPPAHLAVRPLAALVPPSAEPDGRGGSDR